MDVSNFAKKVLRIESESIKKQIKYIDKNFIQAAKTISSCEGKIIVMGIGKSGLIGRKISATLTSVGVPSIFLHPSETLHGDLGIISDKDIIIALSYSGDTEELHRTLSYLKHHKIFIISMTGREKSKLGRISDIILKVSITREACPYNLIPTSSTTVMLSLGDALALTAMRLKKFSRHDFAKIHPAGTIGKKLTLKVKDIMRTGKHNPYIYDNATVKDALFVMTKTKTGATSIVDKKKKLLGFFTDGDLRRYMQKNGNVLERRITEVMSKHPITVSPNILVTEALKIFKRKNCDNLPVVDDSKLVGFLDERDLLSEGLV